MNKFQVFNYIDDASNFTSSLMAKLRQVLVEHALQNFTKTEETSIFYKHVVFEEEIRRRLGIEAPFARNEFDTHKGFSAVPNRVFDSRSYPIYQAMQTRLETKLLSGMRTISPGDDVEEVLRYHLPRDARRSAASVHRRVGWCSGTVYFKLMHVKI